MAHDAFHLLWDHAGLAWHGKRPKGGNENRNGKRPQAGQGQKWHKKWPKNGFLREFSIIFPFLCHFCPCPAWGRSRFRFPFFPISGLWPFSMPCQPGMIPNLLILYLFGWALSDWAMFRKPQPLQLVEKVRQYTSNLYGSAPPICIAVLSWLLSLEERETLQYASHLYCSTPPICTAVRPPFVRQYFWKNTGGWGHRNVSELFIINQVINYRL